MIDQTYNIAPSISMVKNMGMDGTGLHSGYVRGGSDLIISDSKTFEPDNIRIEPTKEYKKRLFRQNMPENFFVRGLVLCQRFIVVLLFLFFDKRKTVKQPLPFVPRFLFSSWSFFRRIRN